MGYLELYILFALTTALAATYELFVPVLNLIKEKAPKSMVGRSPKTMLIVLFLMALVCAPLLIVPVLLPGSGEVFRLKLVEQLIID